MLAIGCDQADLPQLKYFKQSLICGCLYLKNVWVTFSSHAVMKRRLVSEGLRREVSNTYLFIGRALVTGVPALATLV